MRLRSFCLSALILVLPLPLLADTVYTYTGNDFNTVSSVPGAPYTTSDFVSGFFTLSSPLAANLFFVSINPEAFSFSDGVSTVSSSESPLYFQSIEVRTDSSGVITGWQIHLQTALFGNGTPATEVDTSWGLQDIDEGFTQSGAQTEVGFGELIGSKGTWTSAEVVDPTPSAVPEPSSLLLLGTGTLAATRLIRRRLRS